MNSNGGRTSKIIMAWIQLTQKNAQNQIIFLRLRNLETKSNTRKQPNTSTRTPPGPNPKLRPPPETKSSWDAAHEITPREVHGFWRFKGRSERGRGAEAGGRVREVAAQAESVARYGVKVGRWGAMTRYYWAMIQIQAWAKAKWPLALRGTTPAISSVLLIDEGVGFFLPIYTSCKPSSWDKKSCKSPTFVTSPDIVKICWMMPVVFSLPPWEGFPR